MHRWGVASVGLINMLLGHNDLWQPHHLMTHSFSIDSHNYAPTE